MALPGSSLLRVLEAPALRQVLGAFTVSKFGDFLYATALVTVVLQRTGSAGWVAATLIAHLLPFALVTPLAGVLADRMDRRRLMVATDVGRAALMVVATVLVARSAPVWTLLAVALLSSCVGTPFLSAFMATLPDLVEEDRLAAANAAVGGLGYLAIVAGPAVAALILDRGPTWLPFAVDALTFLASAALVTASRRTRGAAGTAAGVASGVESFAQAMRTGGRLVWRQPVMRTTVILAVIVMLAYGLEQVMMPLVSRDLLGTGEAGLGWLQAAMGLGGVLGTAVAAWGARRERLVAVLGVAVGAAVIPMGLIALVRMPVIAYALLLVEGVAAVTADVVVVTIIQRAVARHQIARVDGLVTSAALAASVLGYLLAPTVIAVLQLRAALLLTALTALAAASLVLLLQGRAPVARAAPELTALLRRMPSLDGLDEAGFEALAAAAGPVELLAAGHHLLDAGDPAGEVLLLLHGSCDVLATLLGAPLPRTVLVNQVHGPDLLGEIGVLHGRPRTATVVATSECQVRRVPAEAFRQALTLRAGLPTAIAGTVSSRLARWGG